MSRLLLLLLLFGLCHCKDHSRKINHINATNTISKSLPETRNTIDDDEDDYDEDVPTSVTLRILQDMHRQLEILSRSMKEVKYQNLNMHKLIKKTKMICGRNSESTKRKRRKGKKDGMMATDPRKGEPWSLKPTFGKSPIKLETSKIGKDFSSYNGRKCPHEFRYSSLLNRCYYFDNDRRAWHVARDLCRSRQSTMLEVDSKTVQHYIAKTATREVAFATCDFWLGAREKTRGNWRWHSSDTPITYTNWRIGEPNNGGGDENCAHMIWIFRWAWNDVSCTKTKACFVCQADVNPDGH